MSLFSVDRWMAKYVLTLSSAAKVPLEKMIVCFQSWQAVTLSICTS